MPQIQRFIDAGANVTPIASHTVMSTDTRFGQSADWQKKLRDMTGNEIISSIVDAEPLGPSKKLGHTRHRAVYRQYDEQTGQCDNGFIPF